MAENNRQQYWLQVIKEQRSSGETVRAFCRAEGVGEHTFYMWRKRLRGRAAQRQKKEPVRFALVDHPAAGARESAEAGLELLLPGGERLRIQRGVDAATLRTVLEALRA